LPEIVFSFSPQRLVLLAFAIALMLAASFGGGVLATLVWMKREETLAKSVEKPLGPNLPKLPASPAAGAPPPSATSAPAAATPPPAAAEPALTAPAPAAPPAPVREAPPVSAIRLAVMVGSFRDESNANRLSGRLRELGFEPQQFSLRDSSESIWYAVRLGPLPDWESASRTAAQVRAETQVTPLIRPY
jgi:cell division septation protein DedD